MVIIAIENWPERQTKGHPLVSKGGRVSHSVSSYDQPFMNDLHERMLRDEISVSTGIQIVLFFYLISHLNLSFQFRDVKKF